MTKNSSTPNSGASQPKGKHSECDSAITDALVLKAKPEPVRDATEVPGAFRRAADTQIETGNDKGGGGSNPKHRARNFSGVSEPGGKGIAAAA